MATTAELEEQIQKLEGISIVVRASEDQKFSNYNYSRKAAGNMSVKEWLENRINPIVGEFGVKVLDGSMKTPHGKTNLETLRKSYYAD